MKRLRYFIVFVFFIVLVPSTKACDICGCGLGNYYIGMVPQFNKGFFGVRYQYRSFQTHIANDKTQFSNDYFQTVELWGGLNIGKRWQVLAFVPFSINKQISDDGKRNSKGLGDIAAIINYTVLEKTFLNNRNQLIFQKFLMGGGIKLPTGSSSIDPTAPDIIALANSQLGSGSTDFILNSSYTIRIDKLGFSTNLSYKINTSNKDQYQFGNRLSSNSFIYYSIKGKKNTLTPNLGILYEYSNGNKLDKVMVEQTGGYAALASAGLETTIKKVSLGFNLQAPIAQDFANGQTQSKIRGMLHITFGF